MECDFLERMQFETFRTMRYHTKKLDPLPTKYKNIYLLLFFKMIVLDPKQFDIWQDLNRASHFMNQIHM